MSRSVEVAAVVGGGTMGAGFVQLLALAGLPVRVADATAAKADASRTYAIELALRFEELGLMAAGSAAAVERSAVAMPSAGAAAEGADVVFEAVTEDVAVKHPVLAEVEAAAADHTIIATNTSAIPIRVLAAPLRTPERFLGAHFFNPPQWVPAVEVIPGPKTDPAVVEAMVALLRRLGKDPVPVGDGPGFVANRIQFAMFREAALLVEEGIASADEVDRVVRSSFGFRLPFYGPFTIADMAGLDVYAGAYQTLSAELGPRMSAPESLSDLVSGGRLGTKSGGGFLLPETAASREREEQRDQLYAALERLRAAS
jgi:3-hydroxybutyryl-CoA dehydrogenase